MQRDAPRSGLTRFSRTTLALTLLGTTLPCLAQGRWQPIGDEPTEINSDTLAVYDRVRQLTVLHEIRRGSTRGWDGAQWRVLTFDGPRTIPIGSPRPGASMAYDSGRDRTVLFLEVETETWEWDGADWSLVATTGPTNRRETSMAYDEANARIVLAGNRGGPAGTYAWDGANWSMVSTGGPTGGQFGLSYEPIRGVVLLHSGRGTASSTVETWELNGSTWTDVTPAVPGPGGVGSLLHDEARSATLFVPPATHLAPLNLPPVVEWTGTAWIPVHATGMPDQPFFPHSFVYDVARNQLFGWTSTHTHTFDANGWTRSAPYLTEADLDEVVYDTQRESLLLVQDPIGTFVSFGGTWEWVGSRWVRVGAPLPARGFALAYDEARGVAVALLGTDTYEWNGTSWVVVDSASPDRLHAAMVYDRAHGRIVMFGGSASTSTWAWDGSSWTQLATAGPPARSFHDLAYDAARDRVVLFGGERFGQGIDQVLDDTWEWDGVAWTNIKAPSGPSARSYAELAYDPLRERVVMAGGYTGPGVGLNELGDVWEWDGARWEATGLAERGTSWRHWMAFYPPEQRVLVGGRFRDVGGIFDNRPHLLERSQFGLACAGSAGTPKLAVVDDHPSPGDTIEFSVSEVPVNHTVVHMIGFDPFTPALDLDVIGMVGCDLQTPLDVLIATSTSSNELAWTLAVPNTPGAIGVRIVVQELVQDIGINPFGATTSNAVAVLVR